ncbi:FAD-dependent oxidoreductase [Streptomyces sp. NPDC006692]|uniref:FAD-dependent oxidoreductase n=1 Tax=Streptomyces sp. NPDC006692 TaxID=3364758 RepID=UPI003681B70C
MPNENNEKAVVLGAGFAGLLTAGVLTKFYRQVTVVDWDPATSQYRRGVPQGRHAHNLLPAGARVLDEIFPGLVDEMSADGAVLADVLSDYRFYLGGKELPRVPVGARSVHATRPFYERHLRRRLVEQDGLRMVLGTDVVGLIGEDRRITGVRILPQEPSSSEETLNADLVVDAMGRGSRTPVWLEQLGYERPAEQRVNVDVAYASRLVRLPPQHDRALLIGGDVKAGGRGLLLLAVEDGLHVLTVTGTGPAVPPPTDEVGFAEYVAAAAPDDVVAALKSAEALSDIVAYRFPATRWRRYDQLAGLPDGLITVGDALCSLSPVNAQGLTVAALEASALRDTLSVHRRDVAADYFARATRILTAPWGMAGEPEQPANLTQKMQGAMMSRLMAAAATDPTVAAQLIRVLALLDPPSKLLRPAVLGRALFRAA